MKASQKGNKKRTASKDHVPVSGWILHLESISVSKELMKDTMTPLMTVDVY